MAKLCPKGKAAAKRKFKVYPSAYANMYASGVCSGKIKPGGRKKAMGGGLMTRPMYKKGGGADMGKTTSRGMLKPSPGDKTIHRFGGSERSDMRKKNTSKAYKGGNRSKPKILASGGRINMKSGGGVCIRGMNRDAIGKNS